MLISCGSFRKTTEIIKTVTVYPEIPESWLICADEVTIPEITSQEDFGIYSENQRIAGADCRGNLKKVHDLKETWSK